MDKALRVAIAGEPNAGKTSFANFLLQVNLLPVHVLPNTMSSTLVRFGELLRISREADDVETEIIAASDLHHAVRKQGFLEISFPSYFLKGVEILDLPGIDAPGFDCSLLDLICSADIVIWCSVATQAWKASELEAWRKISARYNAASFLVLTHRDRLSDHEVKDVSDRISRDIGHLFSQWAIVATPQAMIARDQYGHITNMNLWVSSGGEEFLKKLSKTIQALKAARRLSNTRNPSLNNRILSEALTKPNKSVEEEPSHPVDVLLKMKQNFPIEGLSLKLISDSIAFEINNFSDKILKPWLIRNKLKDPEISELITYTHVSPEEVLQHLAGPYSQNAAETTALIFNQLACELRETTENIRPPKAGAAGL
jgi:hypothetical protein